MDDIRVFHCEPDPLSLPSSRFFGMAERLPYRGGAVAHTLRRALEEAPEEAPGRAQGVSSSPEAASLPDISELVGVSGPNNRGFPWIEYRGGTS